MRFSFFFLSYVLHARTHAEDTGVICDFGEDITRVSIILDGHIIDYRILYFGSKHVNEELISLTSKEFEENLSKIYGDDFKHFPPFKKRYFHEKVVEKLKINYLNFSKNNKMNLKKEAMEFELPDGKRMSLTIRSDDFSRKCKGVHFNTKEHFKGAKERIRLWKGVSSGDMRRSLGIKDICEVIVEMIGGFDENALRKVCRFISFCLFLLFLRLVFAEIMGKYRSNRRGIENTGIC